MAESSRFRFGSFVAGLLLLIAGIICGYILSPHVRHWLGERELAGEAAHEHGQPTAPTEKSAKQLYHCPMHPNYISDKPGSCPICGMDLVPIKPEETPQAAGQAPEGYTPITLSPERRQLIGVTVGTVERKNLVKKIRAVGRVGYNEKTQASVSLKFSGWVEELMVKAVGDAVRKGSPLFTIYSPDLYEAQKNYLIARENYSSLSDKTSSENRSLGEDVLRSARERLLLWDFTPDQVKQIEAANEPLRNVTIYSKVEGVVTARDILLGKYVQPGSDLYEISDLSTVWLMADIYEDELPLVKAGQDARVQLSSSPGETLTGKVGYIYPYLNEQSRTVKVRMEFPNEQGKLKPGMFATVFLESPLGERLVVDDTAILATGTRNIVFVDKGNGVLEPREVASGENVDGMTVILSGLSEGEKVVTSGNFLVDSESRLKAALRTGTAPATGHEGHAGMASAQTNSGASNEGMPSMPGMPGMK